MIPFQRYTLYSLGLEFFIRDYFFGCALFRVYLWVNARQEIRECTVGLLNEKYNIILQH